jgi:hypothetical protein
MSATEAHARSTQPGGLKLQKIVLLESRFRLLRETTPHPTYGLALIDFDKRFNAERTELSATLSFDALQGVQDPLIEAKFTFRIEYLGEGDLEKVWVGLKDEIILAHCIPYVREFLSSMTARMPIFPLIIEMVNAYSMFKSFRDRGGSSARIEAVR